MPEVLDQAALANLLEMVGGDPDFVDELVDTFLADVPQQVAELRARRGCRHGRRRRPAGPHAQGHCRNHRRAGGRGDEPLHRGTGSGGQHRTGWRHTSGNWSVRSRTSSRPLPTLGRGAGRLHSAIPDAAVPPPTSSPHRDWNSPRCGPPTPTRWSGYWPIHVSTSLSVVGRQIANHSGPHTHGRVPANPLTAPRNGTTGSFGFGRMAPPSVSSRPRSWIPGPRPALPG